MSQRSRPLRPTITGSALLGLVLALTLTGCSDDSAPGGSGNPSSPTSETSSASPSAEPTQEQSEAPPAELGGATLDQEGVMMSLPEGFPPDDRGESSQQISVNAEQFYAGISTLLPVGPQTRAEQERTILDNTEIERPATVEDDIELDGVTFLHVSGRYTVVRGFRLDLYRAATDELLIGIRLSTPMSWSEERREAYLQPILDSVVVP